MTNEDQTRKAAPGGNGEDHGDDGSGVDRPGGADGEEIEIVSSADDRGGLDPDVPPSAEAASRAAEPAPSRAAPGDPDAARQVAELREQLLRTAADFDNFRKRTERDRVEERKQATAGVVRSMLPVLDSFRRALAQAATLEETPALASFVEGVRLIESQLFDILKAAGLEQVETEGRFDPAHHEALMQEHAPATPHLHILEVFEPGYRLGGRLLRPARVKVAHNPAGEAGAAGDGDGQG